MERFSARVQYDDWRGQAAADNSSGAGIRDLLRQRKLIHDGQFVVGLDFSALERAFVHVTAILIDAENYEAAAQALAAAGDPIKVRKVTVDLSVNEFFTLFKRFHITLSPKGLDIVGCDISAD
jgi:hypothetical protein